MIDIIILALLVFMGVAVLVGSLAFIISEAGTVPELKREPRQLAEGVARTRKAYLSINEDEGIIYIMDDKDIERAHLIIRFDGRDVWMTRTGKSGVWILEARVKDGY